MCHKCEPRTCHTRELGAVALTVRLERELVSAGFAKYIRPLSATATAPSHTGDTSTGSYWMLDQVTPASSLVENA